MKKVWLIVGANVLIATMVVLFLLVIVIAMSALASDVTTWPLFVLIACGVLASVVALQALRSVGRNKARTFASMLNVSAFALYVAVISFVAWNYLSATRQRFIIPVGYEGEVYVVHGVPSGVPEERSFYRTETYRIPDDGVLLSQVPMNMSGTRSEYFYESKDGKLTKISNEWYSTIERTPDNLANKSDVGMYFPRTAGGADDRGCKWSADLFEIGTPSFLLSNQSPIDVNDYLKRHYSHCITH